MGLLKMEAAAVFTFMSVDWLPAESEAAHQVAGEQHFGAVVCEVLKGGDGSADAGVIGDLQVLVEGNVQVSPDLWHQHQHQSVGQGMHHRQEEHCLPGVQILPGQKQI